MDFERLTQTQNKFQGVFVLNLRLNYSQDSIKMIETFNDLRHL